MPPKGREKEAFAARKVQLKRDFGGLCPLILRCLFGYLGDTEKSRLNGREGYAAPCFPALMAAVMFCEMLTE